MNEVWANVQSELDRVLEAGRTVRVWLRDDDCVAVTPALERLAALCSRFDLPILLAVIPEPAEPPLADWIAAHPAVTPCQHGFAHRNHAAPGERARELGGSRPAETVLAELARGRATLQALFRDRLSDILVPPWNRIDSDLIARLPGLGYSALSTFGPADPDAIRHLNSDLDIIDWRNGRVGRSLDDLLRKLTGLLGRVPRSSWPGLSRLPTPGGGTDGAERSVAARDRRVGVGGRDKPGHDAVPPSQIVGILTHHLAHDATAWTALEALLARLHAHPAVVFAEATALASADPDHPPTLPPRP